MSKKIILAFSFVSLLTIFCSSLSTPVRGQTRGDGVGAMASKIASGSLINISTGRTAPWSEVIVENGSGDVQAVAEIDARGIFNFTFYTENINVDNLYIYAVDEAGITNNLRFSDTNLGNFILPPTIVGVNDNTLPGTTLSIHGFAYPGSTVTVTLASEQGYANDFSITANATSGSWELQVPSLASGDYTAKAMAAIGLLESIDSQELAFTISPLAVVIPVGKVGETVTKAVEKLPEPVKATAELVSKATPVASSWFLLQLLYSWLSGIFVGKKRKEKWGILYDAVTKNPIARGIVRLYNRAGVLIETDVTGAEGVFSFFPPPDSYRLDIRKPGYNFPSKTILGRRDGEYVGIYHGEFFEITRENPVVNLSIPMDPLAPTMLGIVDRLRQILSRYSDKIGWLIFIPGFVFSLIVLILRPVAINIIVMLFYILTIVFMYLRSRRRASVWGIVVNTQGNSQVNVELSLFDSILNRQLQRRVSDMAGRYQFVAPAGSYYVAVTSPEFELVRERGSYQGEIIIVSVDKGIVKPKIKVRRKGS